MNKKLLLVLLVISLFIPMNAFAGEVGAFQPIATMGKGQLTCRCGETEHGLAGETKGFLNPLETRYTTYTWVYQW